MAHALSFRTIAERSRDLMALLKPSGDLTYLNTAGLQFVGADVAPRSFLDLLVEADHARFAEQILADCRECGNWEGSLTFRYGPSVTPVPCGATLFTVSDIHDPSVTSLVLMAQPLAENSKLFQRHERILAATTQIASDILASQSGFEALEHFAEAALQLTGARYAAIGVASSEGDHLDEFVTAGLSREQESAIGQRPRGAGVLGLLLHRTTPLRLDALSEHPSSAGFPPNHPPMNAFLGVPIRHGEVVLGSLYLTEKAGGFDDVDEVTVHALGAHLAIAIRNIQMINRQRALVSGMIAGQEEERRAVAYDLHDGLTQYVMAAQMHFSVFRRAIHCGDITVERESLRIAFDAAYRYLTDSVIESRRLVNGLRLLALEDMGLAGALEQLLAEEKERAGWDEALFTHNIGSDRFPQILETSVYRIVQEALTNARKHAETHVVHVVLMMVPALDDSQELRLDIRDQGKGFLPESRYGDYSHIGLHGIAERVRLLEGHLEIDSQPGNGTRLAIRLPLYSHGEDQS